MAALSHRPDAPKHSRYVATIRKVNPETGRKYRTISKSFASAKSRAGWVRDTEREMDAGTWVDPRDAQAFAIEAGTWGDILQNYAEYLGHPFEDVDTNVSPYKDRYSRARLALKIGREIGHLYPNQVTPDYVYNNDGSGYAQLLAYGDIDNGRRELSPVTMQKYWRLAEKAWNHGRDRMKIELPENPFTATRDTLIEDGIIGNSNERDRRIETIYNYTYQGSNPEYQGVTFNQITEYEILMIELQWQGHWLVDIIDFALASTMRCSHIMRIKRSDIFWEANELRRKRKTTEKNKKRHEVYEQGVLPNEALAILKRAIEKQDELPSLAEAERAEIYELVWSKPVHIACHELGLSDQGLQKKCKRLNIPTPPRGYWQKKQNGVKGARRTPLPPMSRDEQGAISELVFPFPLTAQAVYGAFNDLCKRLGLVDDNGVYLTFHCLRHEGVSRLVESPKKHDLNLIMKVTGHTTLESMRRYTHPRVGGARDTFGAAIDAL